MSSKIKDDPFGESDVLVNIQYTLNDVPGVLPTAHAMSYFGEHVLRWMRLAALGAAVDEERRIGWTRVGVAAFTLHMASVIFKRIARRPRSHDRRIVISVGTPSKLSFPPSHVTSTTAALVGMAKLGYPVAPAVGVPTTTLSRPVLGVHHPTDAILGAAPGTTTALVVDEIGDKVIESKKAQHNRGGQPFVAERNVL